MRVTVSPSRQSGQQRRSKRWPTTWAGLIITGIVLGGGLAQATGIRGDDLLTNGGGEASSGVAAGDATSILAPSGWQTTGSFTVLQYGGASADLHASGGPPDGGNNYFAGGPGFGIATAAQTIDVSTDAATIDRGSTFATLRGWLGGWSSQGDYMTIQATFNNAGGAATKGIKIGPVTTAQRDDLSKLLLREARTAVPVGTHSITVTMTATRTVGNYNDGYADDVSLMLFEDKTLSHLELILFKKQYRVDAAYRGSCAAADSCAIASGSTVRICNKDDFNHAPYSLSLAPNKISLKRRGNKHGFLKPKQCFSHRFVNTETYPIQVKLYDELHSQERFVLTILPAK